MNFPPLLIPGQTCWRLERADHLALIVDAADYFRFAKAAMLNAKHCIMLVGWDFDTRIAFEPEPPTLDGPNLLGDFLSWLPKRRPDLHIYVLKWDLGMLQALGRGMTPIMVLDWMTGRRLRLKLDSFHPIGAAHHQKIVIIDDELAFCGGIDITAERWDTSAHLDDDPRRVAPSGKTCQPWHDATTAVDGAVARALGDLARERWFCATGERLEPSPPCGDVWPKGLRANLESVNVAIARTFPKMENRDEVREIEALYLKAISSARGVLYIETQYLASRKVAEALALRLREADGPEIILVLPRTAEGWLEHNAMDGARAKLLTLLWKADQGNRFRAFYPVTAGGTPIYVHAKILVIDDWLLRVGSSNLNNRSMGFDTECDLAVEAASSTADDRIRAAITSVRRDLLCEHLGVAPEAFEAALQSASGSLLTAVDGLLSDGKSLRRFNPSDVAAEASSLAENELIDPERAPERLGQRLGRAFGQMIGRGAGPA